jgi:hypothetical protein
LFHKRKFQVNLVWLFFCGDNWLDIANVLGCSVSQKNHFCDIIHRTLALCARKRELDVPPTHHRQEFDIGAYLGGFGSISTH